VQYKITEPEKYIFNFRDVENTLRLMSEASMRAVVGDYTIDELITEGRAEIEVEAQKRLTELNCIYETGATIEIVKLKRVDVPKPVQPALSEVEEAKQEKARLINMARQEFNKIIPRAQGEARQAIAAAEGYQAERVNRARGDAERFDLLYNEYKKAKEVTRARMYFESLAEVLPRAKQKLIVDSDVRGLLPLLNMTPATKNMLDEVLEQGVSDGDKNTSNRSGNTQGGTRP
jgi:membrane protease subunit HflK